MNDGLRLYQERGAAALWDRCLGYLDYDLERTMALQHQLLEDQFRILGRSEYGTRMFHVNPPVDAREMRERLPLTTYEADYRSTLGEQRADLLSEEPRMWLRTSGRSGGPPKWFPVAPAAFEAGVWASLGGFVLSTATDRREYSLPLNPRTLSMVAPHPYASGTYVRSVSELWPMDFMPPATEDVDAMAFGDRMALGFSRAVSEGVDIVTSMAAVMVQIGETFSDRSPSQSLIQRLSRPRAGMRMARAALRARLAGRDVRPVDAWNLSGILVAGMDTTLFRERVNEYWGRYPLEMLASTEGTNFALQAWDYSAMTLVPTLNFYEFIPEDQLAREDADPSYEPQTVLQPELQAGQNYEVVLTNLHGGPMVRFRTGDIIRVTALRSAAADIELPQLVHYTRRTDLIEFAGFVRLTEQTVWEAIDRASIPYVDWTARKEIEDSRPVLRIRLELKPGVVLSEADATAQLHRSMSELETDWADMEEIAGLSPIKVTFLPSGTFARFQERRVTSGADFGQMKPVHMGATDDVIRSLIAIGDGEMGD